MLYYFSQAAFYTSLAVIPLILNWIRLIPDSKLCKNLAFLSVSILVLGPFFLTTNTVAGDYAMAASAIVFVLKVLEMFFCSPELDVQQMSTKEFLMRLTMYPDEDFLKHWQQATDSHSKMSQEEKRLILLEGRWDSFFLLLKTLKYFFGLNVLMMLLPARPALAVDWPKNDWHYWAFMYLGGWGVYLLLHLAFCFGSGLMGLFWGCKSKKMFNSPFVSQSLREWWSQRWNLCFKDQFYKIVFKLLTKPETPQKDQKKKEKQKKNQKMKIAAAAFCTFIFSGILHEYYVYITFRQTPTFENTLYFLLNGVGTSVQVMYLSKWTQNWNMPKLVKIFFTSIFLMSTTALFQGPYMRGEFYTKIDLPYLPGTKHILSQYWMPALPVQ